MKPWLEDPVVAVTRGDPRYAGTPPYDPSDNFPECKGQRRGSDDNPAYRAVRGCFAALGLDAANFGLPEWNPLGEMIQPGNTVALKPNLVAHRNAGEKAWGLTDTDSLVTHGSVVRAVLDYVAIALKGSGRVLIGDCPVQGTSWEQVVQLVGLDQIIQHAEGVYPGIEVVARDYRLCVAEMRGGRLSERIEVDSPANAYVEPDLGPDSLLVPLMSPGYSFGVAQYPRRRMAAAHTPQVNRYLFPSDFVNADTFINLPKMKSHMKAGITCALKNLVGINGHKDYLPHFRFGSPKQGGDEYPDGNWLWDLYWRLQHAEWEIDRGPRKWACYQLASGCEFLLRWLCGEPRGFMWKGGGGWHGNDTLWRTVLDINRAFLYSDPSTGKVGSSPCQRRRYLAVLDGLVGGHRESPLCPSPVKSGLIMAARNPVALDTVAAAFMGCDLEKLPQICNAYSLPTLPLTGFSLTDVALVGLQGVKRVADIYSQRLYTRFEPSAGWRGSVEYRGAEA